MSFFKLKTVVPLLALFFICLSFLYMRRDDETLPLPSKGPLDRLASQSSQVQLPSPTASAAVAAAAAEQCDGESTAAGPVPLTEWLTRKNYTRAYIRPHRVSFGTRFSTLENIETPVLPPFVALERGMVVSNESQQRMLPCAMVAEVDVAVEPSVEETSKFLFGLATTVDRLDRMLPSLLYSYGNSKAGIVVLVPDSDDDTDTQQAYFRNRGLDVTIKKSPLDFTARYFGLVRAFAEHIRNERPWTTWVSFVDDDTFWLSLSTLAEELSVLDATERHYIGSLSEATWQVNSFGRIAFGGAGMFVSKPLLDVLETHFDECLSWGDQPGDQKVAQCIQRFSDTPLTLWPSLFQMDMRGDVDGVYESGRKIHSLHHWASWYEQDVVKMGTVSAVAGRRSVLRRWVFDQRQVFNDLTRGSIRQFWVLTNGYSIVKYTYDEHTLNDIINFDHMEKTWIEDSWAYEERLGPLRPSDVEGVTKERWLLHDAYLVGKNVHQLYTREDETGHSVIEIVWLDPQGSDNAVDDDSAIH